MTYIFPVCLYVIWSFCLVIRCIELIIFDAFEKVCFSVTKVIESRVKIRRNSRKAISYILWISFCNFVKSVIVLIAQTAFEKITYMVFMSKRCINIFWNSWPELRNFFRITFFNTIASIVIPVIVGSLRNKKRKNCQR